MSSIILPGQGIDKRKGKKEALEIDPAAPKALTMIDVHETMKSMAVLFGNFYGVKLTVGLRGSDYFFLDDVGQVIFDRGGNREPMAVIACSMGEVMDGMWMQLFAGRAMWAAAAERMNMKSRGEK